MDNERHTDQGLGYSADERIAAMEAEERRKLARRAVEDYVDGLPEGIDRESEEAVEVTASAAIWGEVVAELVWIGEEWDGEEESAEAYRLLQTLANNTPKGVEKYEDSTEDSYTIRLTPAEAEAIERVTGIGLPSPTR